MKRILIIPIYFLVSSSLFSQVDSLATALKNGRVSGYWRNFFMVTQNQNSLKDWNALATGGLLKYETGSFKNFKIGLGYYTSYNTNISDVAAKDDTTGRVSRYEAGLFDVQDLSKREIHFLGELYLKYATKGHEVTLGRMKLNTAFINPQDGRMIPTLEQGILYKNSSFKNTTLQAAWLTHIAARSSSGFTSVDNSIGIYPVGRNTDGSASGYYQNLQSKGIGIFSAEYKTKKMGVELTDYLVENIFNTAYAKAFYALERDKIKWKLSAQYLHQNKLNNGGNDDTKKSYFQQKQSNVFGAQLEAGLAKDLVFSANYNYISAHGIFLFPREWGRETLFTFQKRERFEGVSNAQAFMLSAGKNWKLKNKSQIKIIASFGHYARPDAKNAAQNKYAMPANSQTNLDLFYDFDGALKGLGLEYLVSYKRASGETYENPNFILNKVNMLNHNLVMNYKF